MVHLGSDGVYRKSIGYNGKSSQRLNKSHPFVHDALGEIECVVLSRCVVVASRSRYHEDFAVAYAAIITDFVDSLTDSCQLNVH